VTVYSLFVENVFNTFLQMIAAASRSIGFMKLDPNGVEAANIMSPTSKPTSKQTASGPLVMNPVNVPMFFMFLRHSMVISMAKPMRNISRITPAAPTEARRTFPPKSRELPVKNIRTRAQAIRSRRPTEFVRKIFKVWLDDSGGGLIQLLCLVMKSAISILLRNSALKI